MNNSKIRALIYRIGELEGIIKDGLCSVCDGYDWEVCRVAEFIKCPKKDEEKKEVDNG